MSEWQTGPTWAEVAEQVKAEQALHAAAWGARNGLRDLHVQRLDTPLPDAVDQGGLVVIRMHTGPTRHAAVVALGFLPVRYAVEEDGERVFDDRCVIAQGGTSRGALEELTHKLLAAAGLVPYRKDGVGGSEYRITWQGGQPTITAEHQS